MSVPRGDARQIAQGPRARSRKAALRLYRDWEEELHLNSWGEPHLAPTKAQELEEALVLLRDRHPGIETEAGTTTEPPRLSAAASAKIVAQRGRARADEALGHAAEAASDAAGSAGRYALRHSGAQAAARDWTRTTLQALGAMAGIALLYLIVAGAARRRGAGGSVPDVLYAFAHAFRRFFSPRVDLLGGGGRPSGQPDFGGIPFKDLHDADIVAGPLRPPGLPRPSSLEMQIKRGTVAGPLKPAALSSPLEQRIRAGKITGPLRPVLPRRPAHP